MKRILTFMAVLSAVFLFPGSAPGNGMRLVSQDAFAAARGEAFVATADTAAAIYYNPAGLTQLLENELRAGVYGLYFNPTYQPPAGATNAGQTYELNRRTAAAPQSFLAFSAPAVGLAGGLGVYAPYGADVTWPQDTGFRAVAISAQLLYLRFNPAVAVRFSESFSLGFGVMVDYGDFEMVQGLLRTETPFKNYFRFKGDAWDVGANFGLRWQPSEQLVFGATCRTETSLNFEGRTEIEMQPAIQPTHLPAAAEFDFPLTVAFGISYRPTPRWNLEVNADYTDWSCLDSVMIRQFAPAPFPVRQNIPVTLEWEASWIYSVGVTRFLDNGWRLSAGYAFNESSVPDDYYSPLAADLDRHFVALGVGRRGERLDFDLTYQFGYGPAHTVTGSQPPSQPGLFTGQRADGTYDFISHAVMVSVGWRF